MNSITVRKMTFDFPDDMDMMVIPGDRTASALLIGASLLLPYLEPYLIRTMRKAIPLVEDKKVQEEMKLFCSQEANHFKQHRQVNDILRQYCKDPEALATLEAEMDADYRGWSNNRSLKWNLAYAEGFEAFTSATALMGFKMGLLDDVTHPLAKVSEWHLMEELEHRTVAFDAYEHAAGGGYLFKSRVALFAQWHFLSYAWRMGKLFLMDEADMAPEYRTAEFQRQVRNRGLKMLAKAPFIALKLYMPGYAPHKLQLPERFAQLQAKYS